MFRASPLTVNFVRSRKSTIERWLIRAGRYSLPPTCLLCGAPGGCDATGCALDLCADCDRTLPRRGGQPLASPPWELLVAPYRYAWPIDHCVRALKFHGEAACGRLLGLLLARERREVAGPLPQFVLPMPLHRARYLGRGYNQAAVIGRYAAWSLGLPFAARGLERRRATAEQSHLRGAARALNVAGAFQVRPGNAFVGCRVALVDDVLTTGSTAREATRALLASQAAAVELWVAARVATRGRGPPQVR